MEKIKKILLCLLSILVFSKGYASFIPGDGLAAEGKGDWQKAISIYKNEIKKDPKRIDLWLRIASIAKHLKNYPQVFAAYKQAIAINPNDPLLYQALSQNYAEANQPNDALAAIREALKLDPNNIDFLTSQAKLSNWAKNLPLAKESYERLIKLDPNNAKHFRDLSEIYAELKQLKEALLMIDEALKRDPENISYLKTRANFAIWIGKRDIARESYLHILKINPEDKEVKGNLATLDKSNVVVPTMEGESSLALPPKAVEAEKNKQWTEAITFYHEEIKKNAKRVDLWVRLAEIEYQLKHIPETIYALQQAISIEPNKPEYKKRLSEVYAEYDQPKEALAAIEAAVKLAPDNISYLKAQAILAEWAKDYPLAIDSYKALLRKEPKNGLYYQKLSQIYAEKKQAKEAFLAMDEALKIDPKNLEYLRAHAILAVWSGNEKIAAASYKKILLLKPEDKEAATALKHLASINPPKVESPTNKEVKLTGMEALMAKVNNLASLHRYEEAIQTLKNAMRQSPSKAKLYKKLAEIYSTIKQAQPALEAINAALALEPNNIDYLFIRAELANWSKDNQQALDSYQRILKIEPNNPKALLQFARILSWSNKLDAAKKAYRYYLRCYPKNTPEAWVEYANIASWTSDYIASFRALDRYCQLFGKTELYLKTSARILAISGRYQSALNINEALLRVKPNDSYLLGTQIMALQKAYNKREVINLLSKLNRLSPDSKDTADLSNSVLKPLRTNLDIGVRYDAASNTVKIIDLPFRFQKFISPTTSLIGLGLYETLSASLSSGLATVTGQTKINDAFGALGFKTEITSFADLQVLGGVLEIERGPNLGVYDLQLDSNVDQTLNFSFQSARNLFHPYLTATSPKMVSLAVMENRNAILLQWEPLIEKFLSLYTDHSDLSDANSFWHVVAKPKARVYSGQNLLVSLGVMGDWWMFRKRLNDGYYSPEHFQEYAGTYEFFIVQSPKLNFWVGGATGIQKDETFSRYYLAHDLGIAASYLHSNWQTKLYSGLTLRGGPSGTYKEWSIGGNLTYFF